MSEARIALWRRLWIYQNERFPMGRTALLVAVFSAAGISASAHFSGRALPGWPAFALAFGITLALFFHLRVFDEIKDAEDDAKYRPERPIPRGLVSQGLIVRIGLVTAAAALGVCLAAERSALGLLLLAWGWMLLMGFEFFVPHWLRTHPAAYLVSHMAIMPLIDLFVTGVEWTPHGAAPAGLALFLALSFVNGCILEFGRKLWAPEHERAGVDSYSALYGPERAASVWMGCIVVALGLLTATGFATGAPLVTFGIGILAAICVLHVGLAYRRTPTLAREKAVDNAAGLWVLVCYLAAGFAPYIERLWA